MSSGQHQSRSSMSPSSQSEDEHPVDDVIRRALKRGSEQGSPMTSNVVSTHDNKGQKRRKRSQTVSSAEHSPDEHTDQNDSKPAKRARKSSEDQPVSIPPVGVTIVEEGQHVRNAEMQRLLRGARQVSLHLCLMFTLLRLHVLPKWRSIHSMLTANAAVSHLFQLCSYCVSTAVQVSHACTMPPQCNAAQCS